VIARVRMMLLAWRAYGGNIPAGVDLYKILRVRNKGVQLLTHRLPDPEKFLADLRARGAL
jgi:hypothetical protein